MSLRFFLLKATGKVPSTEKLEQNREKLSKNFETFTTISESDDLKRYLELQQRINSEEYKNEKQKIENLKYKETNEFKREQEYEALKKNKKLQRFLEIRESDAFRGYLELDTSDVVVRYNELSDYVKSDKMKSAQKRSEEEFRASEEYNILREWEQLKDRGDLKAYFDFKKSKDFTTYTDVLTTSLVKDWELVKEEVEKKEFKEYKSFCLDKKRFEKSELYAEQKEYETLANRDDIKTYLKYKDSSVFEELERLELIFEDRFDGLNREKWNTIHAITENTINAAYSQSDDLQGYTDKNLDFNSGLKLRTKKEATEAFQWNPQMGFVKSNFDYSSAQINSANKFDIDAGVIEVKASLASAKGLSQAIYLTGATHKPHIEIVGADKSFRAVINNGNETRRIKLPNWFNNQKAIYRLEWDSVGLVWKINDVEIHRESFMADEPLYLNIAASVQNELGVQSSEMGVDWIRVFRNKELD